MEVKVAGLDEIFSILEPDFKFFREHFLLFVSASILLYWSLTALRKVTLKPDFPHVYALEASWFAFLLEPFHFLKYGRVLAQKGYNTVRLSTISRLICVVPNNVLPRQRTRASWLFGVESQPSQRILQFERGIKLHACGRGRDRFPLYIFLQHLRSYSYRCYTHKPEQEPPDSDAGYCRGIGLSFEGRVRRCRLKR